jgi:DNA-binding LacI/PurR family transcriptional regulator
MRRLIGLGHREIRYVREADDAPSSSDRELGVRQAAPDTRVVRFDGAELPVRDWVDEGATAIVVEGTDTGAAHRAVRTAVAAAGLSAPADLSVAVLGGQSGESGFAVPMREMGRRAVRLLVDLVTEKTTTRQQLLWCPPVAGEDVGAPRSG